MHVTNIRSKFVFKVIIFVICLVSYIYILILVFVLIHGIMDKSNFWFELKQITNQNQNLQIFFSSPISLKIFNHNN